jgi:excisionase family DNA binding protein
MNTRNDPDRSTISPIAYSIKDAPQAVGVSRTRIFEAVRNKELTARKAGRSTIIESDELKRWVKSLPIKGRVMAEAPDSQ